MSAKTDRWVFSTLTEALIFWATITNPSYHSLLVAPSRPRAQSLFEISNTFYENLPDWFKPIRKYKTKNEIIFEQPNEKLRKTQPGLGSSIRITPAKDLTAPRGLALSAAHLSETPYYDGAMDEFYPALASAIPNDPRTIIIMESTPLGRGGYFYDTYMGAKFKDSEDPEIRSEWNGFEPIFLPWMIDPRCSWPKSRVTQDEIEYILSHLDKYEIELVEKFKCDVYQLKWRREEIKANCNNDVTKFRRENPATEEEAFALSGTYFFSEEARNYYETIDIKINKEKDPVWIHKADTGVLPPVAKQGFLYYSGNANLMATTVAFKESADPRSPVRFYCPPQRDEEYVMGVDPAYGMERDYSSIVVMDRKLNVCATFYANDMPIDLFEDEIIKFHKLYNGAMLNLETTGPGNGMMFKLRKNIKRWWAWEKWDSPDKRRKLQSIGFDATNRSNSALDTLLTWAFNTKMLKTTDHNLIGEMLVYQYFEESDKGGAPSGYHDDIMRATALALVAVEDLGLILYAKKSPESVWVTPEDVTNPLPEYFRDNSIMPDWYTG